MPKVETCGVDLPRVQSEQRCLQSVVETSFPVPLPFFQRKERGWGGGGGVPILGYLPGSVPGLELPWFCEKFPLTRDFFPTSLLPSKHIAL